MIVIVAVWILSGVIAAGFMGGWKYYVLYPEYPTLGTPDEQWEEDEDSLMWPVAMVSGPGGLIVGAFISGFRVKY